MLTANHTPNSARARQSGAVLVITLIVLVAMTIAVISLMRSVDTTNIIAGNLAFRQSATHSADAGIEDAINNLLPFLVNSAQLTALNCPAGFGYKSFYEPNLDPPTARSWEAFWNSLGSCPHTMQKDANGNTVDAANNIVALGSTIQYIVEAMCDQNGQIGSCAHPPPGAIASCAGSNKGSSNQGCPDGGRNYYRITSRVQGPRNTVSYVQTIVAM